MHLTQKGNSWHFGMKAHIGVDADSGWVHTVREGPAHVNDAIDGNSLLHGQKNEAFGDAGYQGIEKGPMPKKVVLGISSHAQASGLLLI